MDIYPRVELLDHIVTLENPAMATGLEKFNLHPNFQEGQQKNVQTTGQLHLSPMLARLSSESSKLGLSITLTENFQIFKLGLEKAEELEI